MMNLTIKQIVDKYSEYLKTQNLTDKKYNKLLNNFKLDLINNYYNGDFYIIDSNFLENVNNKFIKNIDKLLIGKDDLNNFIFNKKDLEYSYFK
jgi:hypothetical protein